MIGGGNVCSVPSSGDSAQEFSQSEIDDDLHPLTHEECRRRGIRHASEDEHCEIKVLVPGALALEYRDLMRRAS